MDESDPGAAAMESSDGDRPAAAGQVSRRTVLAGVGIVGAATGLSGTLSAPAMASPIRPTAASWDSFGRSVSAEFRRMNLIGAAVAVVTPDQIVHRQPLGIRDRARPWAFVTPTTSFLVASTTKSMSSLLAATHVDQGRFGWDDRVADVWSGFRAPTEQLTRGLRVRDLFGMASGIDEPPALSALHQGDPTAQQLLQSMVNLPVAAEPGQRWIYNNTVYAVGGYLPALAAGVASADLAATYTTSMHQRVFGPVGMTGARIADDPRGVVGNYARGHGLDLGGGVETLPYGPVGSYAPVGGGLATLNDMAAYVQLQLRQGESRTGKRVVSAENLAECWKPHIPVPTSPDFDPDVVSAGYGMGWIRNTFRDGTSLVWHNGAIDGFTAYIGFLPERKIGLVVLNALNPFPTGFFFYTYVLDLLLSERYGINTGVPAKIHEAYEATVSALRTAGRRSRPVSRSAVEPYLGFYEGGYRLVLSGSELQLLQGSRVLPIRASADGDYLMAGGLLLQVKVLLQHDADGTPTIELEGLERVRRTVSPD